jgi:outer membrane biosynthesis protein TonB
MPEVPMRGVPITALGALEIVVGVDGLVVSARLVPTSNRYQDRMMVSAAKTWRFAPARRYGQPVRYRLLMPITW